MAKQGLKKGQVTAKRAYEMADSLQKKAQFQAGAMDFEAQRLKYAKTPQEKADATSILEGLSRVSNHNYAKADRYRNNANKAVAKATAGRDTPLPSSDGIIGSITNKISELFK